MVSYHRDSLLCVFCCGLFGVCGLFCVCVWLVLCVVCLYGDAMFLNERSTGTFNVGRKRYKFSL